MKQLLTTKELLIGLLKIGGTPDVEALFDLIVKEAPTLVGAKECSIFWKDGAWRKEIRHKAKTEYPDAFYRRATYVKKKNLIGVDYYRPSEGLTGWVAKHAKTLKIDDITDQKQLKTIASDLEWKDKQKGYHDSQDQDRQRAFLAVPVMIDGEVMGIIRIAKTLEPYGTFSEDAQNLLEIFAKYVATIIKRVEEVGLKNLWEKLYLSGISFRKDDFSNYLQQVSNEIPQFLGAQACSIFLLEKDIGLLKLFATTEGGPLTHQVDQATYEIGEGLTGWVAKHNKSLLLKDVDDNVELKKYGSDLKHKGKHEEYVKKHSSFLASPISLGDQVFGVIRIAQDSAGKFFSISDQYILEYFCKNLAVLVQNVSLFKRIELEKDDAIKRLQHNQKELQKLGKLFQDDISNIKKGLSEIIPNEVDDLFIRIGPIDLEKKPQNPNTVFIGIPFSSYYINMYKFAILPALEKTNMKPWIANEEITTKAIMKKIFDGMQQSSISIVDISEWNPNVLFELGVLYGQNHQVILLKREDAKVPTDLAGLEYIQYGEFSELSKNLVQYLISYK